MTTREKIIVGIMCLTIVYGAYELLGSRRPKDKDAPTAKADTVGELKSFVADVTGKLVGEKVSKEYQYIISKADTNWNKDPFIHSSQPLQTRRPSINLPKKPGKTTNISTYVYSGFIQLGKKKMAIINGIEYSTGEKLPDSKYYVKTITSQKVIIGKVGSQDSIQVSIIDSDS